MNNNLEFWDSVSKTNPAHTKQVKKGALTLTAINASHQVRTATGKWGMYGKSWGLKDIKIEYINNLTNEQSMAVCQAVFYYPDGDFEIGSSIMIQSWVASKSYHRIDDDFLKKIETDMLTKSLSKLGFNSDVFEGRYDDNKYVSALREEFKPTVQAVTLTDKNVADSIEKGKQKVLLMAIAKGGYKATPEQITKLEA